MSDFTKLFRRLLNAPELNPSSLGTVSQDQGIYTFWLRDDPSVCLKVGIAGPRNGKGLRERVRYHYSSNMENSVLARHLAADVTSPWSANRDFSVRKQRQSFLAVECHCRALPVPGITSSELRQLEAFVVGRLNPRYIGRIRKKTAR